MACEQENATGCFNEGVMAMRADDREAAERVWRRACDLGHALGCANLAGRLVERDPDDAEAPARRACEAGESLGCANLADVLAGRDDLDGAIMFARNACENRLVAGCSNLAWYQLRNDQPIDALQSATRAVDLDGNHLEAREHLGYALIVAGDEDRAVEQLGMAVSLSRGQTSDYRVMGSGSRVEEIRDKIRRLQRIYPNRRRALRSVVRRQREWAPERSAP